MAGHLVWEDDRQAYDDAGYTGMGNYMDEEKNAMVSQCSIAAKRGTRKKKMEEVSPMKTLLLAFEKANIRAKMEHPFHIIKNRFSYRRCAIRV